MAERGDDQAIPLGSLQKSESVLGSEFAFDADIGKITALFDRSVLDAFDGKDNLVAIEMVMHVSYNGGRTWEFNGACEFPAGRPRNSRGNIPPYSSMTREVKPQVGNTPRLYRIGIIAAENIQVKVVVDLLKATTSELRDIQPTVPIEPIKSI